METARLLSRVGRRLRINRAARVGLTVLASVAALATLLLLLARLLGWADDAARWTLFAAPLAGLLAFVFTPQIAPSTAARFVDEKTDSHDLFLTAVGLTGRSDAENFAPLVARQAQEKARNLRAGDLVLANWPRRLLAPAGALLAFAALWFFMPRLDPFKTLQASEEQARKESWKREARKVTENRKAELVEIKGERERNTSAPVEKLLDTLQKVRQNQPIASEEFHQRRQELGDAWKRIQDQKLQEEWRNQSAQAFGGPANQKAREIARAMKEGNVRKAKEMLKELAQNPDQLKAAADALAREMGGKSLEEALRRAADQAAMGENASDTMDLAAEELQRMADAMGDSETLRKALETLDNARKTAGNAQGQNSENQAGGGKTMEERLQEYEEYYREQLAQNSGEDEGVGEGMKGPGTGEGGEAPEGEVKNPTFEKESAASPLVTGKTLLDWKTRGMGSHGEKQAAQESIRKLQESVTEAIVKERVPAGYHQGIGKYFETLREP